MRTGDLRFHLSIGTLARHRSKLLGSRGRTRVSGIFLTYDRSQAVAPIPR